MNAITPTNAKPLAKTASEECSPGLWRRLTDSGVSYFQAADEMAADPVIRGELELVAAQIQRHAEPCGAKAVVSLLTPMVTLYGVSDKSEGEWKAFWGFYIEALRDIPVQALKDGIAEYVADGKSEFFPKPGPLRAICLRHAGAVFMAASRARRALATDPKEAARRI